jgi:hypothetical protein
MAARKRGPVGGACCGINWASRAKADEGRQAVAPRVNPLDFSRLIAGITAPKQPKYPRHPRGHL